MSLSLGEKLRAAREQRGISISEVAEQTRISPLYLEAIDADNYKTLPGGIFNKGFVRSYAKYVGIDEQEALQDYSRLIAETQPADDGEFKAYRPEVLTDDRAASSIVPTVIFAAVILGLMTAGILFLVNYIQNQQSEPPIAANSAVNTNQANNAAANTAPQQPAQTSVSGPFKVEFAAVGDAISVTSVTDNGKSTEELLQAGNTKVFEAKESLKLRYSRSRAQFAQLKLNGKSIALPGEPANPRASTIEIDINQANLSQVFQNGAITLGAPTVAATDANTAVPAGPARPTPRPATSPKPGSPTANTAAPPANVPTMTARPRPNATPVVVGNAARKPDGN